MSVLIISPFRLFELCRNVNNNARGIMRKLKEDKVQDTIVTDMISIP